MTAISGPGISDTGDIDQSRGCERRKINIFYADMFIRLLLLPSRIQYAGINKLTSICSIIVLINILPPTTSGLGLRNTDKQILSTCDLELSRCPMDHDSVEHRKVCMNNYKGCQRGTSYLCGVDTTDEYIVETCQPGFSCQPGTSFQYVVILTAGQPETHLECVSCLGDRFEPEWTNSSLTSITAGCPYVHVPQENLSSHLVLFERGSKSKASLYMCDYKSNFHERNGIAIVDDIPTRSYECVQKFCPVGALLHPDGRCIDCNTELVPEDEFVCYDPLGKNSNGTASMGASQEGGDTKVSIPAIVVPGVLVIAFILVVVCFVHLRRRRAQGNVYNRANDRENPPEESPNNNNEKEQDNAETACNNANNINNFTIGTNFQGIAHLEVHYHNDYSGITGDNAMPEKFSSHVSPKTEEDESLKPHLRMHPLNYGASIEDQ